MTNLIKRIFKKTGLQFISADLGGGNEGAVCGKLLLTVGPLTIGPKNGDGSCAEFEGEKDLLLYLKR